MGTLPKGDLTRLPAGRSAARRPETADCCDARAVEQYTRRAGAMQRLPAQVLEPSLPGPVPGSVCVPVRLRWLRAMVIEMHSHPKASIPNAQNQWLHSVNSWTVMPGRYSFRP